MVGVEHVLELVSSSIKNLQTALLPKISSGEIQFRIVGASKLNKKSPYFMYMGLIHISQWEMEEKALSKMPHTMQFTWALLQQKYPKMCVFYFMLLHTNAKVKKE